MDALAPCQVTIHDPRFRQHLLSQLREQGIVTISGVHDRAALLALARRLLQPRPHRDAGPDGVTVITAENPTAAPGYAAFTNYALVPHTDGSGQARPPGLLVLSCLRAAPRGGETTVADGQEIAATLATSRPRLLTALCSPQAACFGGPNGYTAPVLAPAGEDRMTIRLRLDNLVLFSIEVQEALPQLRAAISQHQRNIKLAPGQAIILSNTRWLHGRTRYEGDRMMLRILGDPRPAAHLESGFPWPAEVSNPTSAATAAIAGVGPRAQRGRRV
jgi:alpha-ketoglutarate-dependent taurine dioxygenase